MTDRIPPSTEALIEAVRRESAGLEDYDLDVRIAETQARRDVAAAHRYAESAEAYNRLLQALADVRSERDAVRLEIEDLTGPGIRTRPLTAAEIEEEPPC